MKRRVSETRLQCRVCGGVYSEHEVRLKVVDPDADEVLCPNYGSAQMEPYPFDPSV
jgi:hypothetical protein